VDTAAFPPGNDDRAQRVLMVGSLRWQKGYPDALAAFHAVSAWRGWSDDDPAVHFAFYEFPTLDEAKSVGDSDAMKTMRADFDQNWQDRVARTREYVEVAQSISR